MNPSQWEIVRVVSICVLAVLFIVYQRVKRLKGAPSVLKHTLKASCTMVAVLNAFLCAYTLNASWAWVLFFGVLMGMCADVLIGINLIWGGLAFAAGHFLYVAAFFMNKPPTTTAYIVFAALSAVLIVYLFFMRRLITPKLRLPLTVYAVVIAAMVACAFPQNNAARVGAALFVASDSLLLVNGVGKGNRVTDYVCLGLYFAGQLLIGMSPML